MDQIIRQFAEKTPVHLLDKHRRCMQKLMFSICQFGGSVFNVLRQLQLPIEDWIMTGSSVEGASLARLFSPDDNTSGEYEYDIMVPITD